MFIFCLIGLPGNAIVLYCYWLHNAQLVCDLLETNVQVPLMNIHKQFSCVVIGYS